MSGEGFEVFDALLCDNDGTDERDMSDVADVASEADWDGDEDWETVS